MRRGLTGIFLAFLGLYLALHLALGSSPVQRRVLAEIRAALAKFGLDLQMESIEFSALSPKIYLNRVTVSAGPTSPIHLPQPVIIDKIKIQFQPLALIYRQIIIDELVLFHPTISVPDADEVYQQIEKLGAEKKGARLQSGSFSLLFRKVGVVDALMEVRSQDPPFLFRSRSVSAFVQNNAGEQQTISLESNDIQLERGRLKLNLTKVDVDVDLTKRSLRVNRAIVESEPLSINVKGVSSLPLRKGKLPESLSASYDIQGSLGILSQLGEWISAPPMSGRVSCSGMVRQSAGALSGSGTVRYEDIDITGHRLGRGNFSYNLGNDKIEVQNAIFHYAGGEVRSPKLSVTLRDSFPISGQLTLHGILLEEILDSVKVRPSPVRLGLEGKINVSGTLREPFEIRGDTDLQLRSLVVLKHRHEPVTEQNTVLTVKQGGLSGLLTFNDEKMVFDTVIHILGGDMKAEGYVGYEEEALIKAKSEALSLTELRHISELTLGGTAAVNAQIDVRGGEAKIAGSFDMHDGEVGKIVLGTAKGETFFQNDLLSFENIELPAIESVLGSGFIDFKPLETHYKFTGNARRIETNQVFAVFQKTRLSFEQPGGGELSSLFTIEGGHDDKGIEVTASGQGKGFTWYGEKWASSNFNLRYRVDDIDLSRLLLMKKSGAVEVKGRFSDTRSRLLFASRGLRLEELDYLHGSPVSGEIQGEIAFVGDGKTPFVEGNGEAKLVKTVFRASPLPDTFVSLHSSGRRMEFLGSIGGEKLRGKFMTSDNVEEISFAFRDFDFTPFATLFLSKDIPSIHDVTGSGEGTITGKFSDFSSLKGGGVISALNLGFTGAPMRSKHAIQVKLDNGSIRVPRFELEGTDTQVSAEVSYELGKKIQASVDARLDLSMLQPFIPGLEYGSGKVTASVRVSGAPARYEMLGNATLEDGTFRLSGLLDDFRGARGQFSLSHDRINLDRFEATINGGNLTVDGDVRINRFATFSPNLGLHADRVAMRIHKALLTRLSGEFTLRGSQTPYLMSGTCDVLEATLSDLSMGLKDTAAKAHPFLKFDVNCAAKDHLFVNTDIAEGEFRGNFHIVGDSGQIGILGSAEAVRGTLIFKDTRFNLQTGTVRFESPTEIAPRFSVYGQARVKEQKLSRIQVSQNESASDRLQEYEVNLSVFGTPADYKIRLSSSPTLAENDIISLLLLGVTSRGQEGGNYADLGSALVGQIPLQSKFQNEWGLDIRLRSQAPNELHQVNSGGSGSGAAGGPPVGSVPSVQIEKEITKSTRLSFSNTLENNPTRELKLEQILDEGLSIDASVERTQIDPASPPIQSYGLDFRYKFHFQ